MLVVPVCLLIGLQFRAFCLHSHWRFGKHCFITPLKVRCVLMAMSWALVGGQSVFPLMKHQVAERILGRSFVTCRVISPCRSASKLRKDQNQCRWCAIVLAMRDGKVRFTVDQIEGEDSKCPADWHGTLNPAICTVHESQFGCARFRETPQKCGFSLWFSSETNQKQLQENNTPICSANCWAWQLPAGAGEPTPQSVCSAWGSPCRCVSFLEGSRFTLASKPGSQKGKTLPF